MVHEGRDDFLVVFQVVFDQFVEFGLFEGLVLEFFLFLFIKKGLLKHIYV